MSIQLALICVNSRPLVSAAVLKFVNTFQDELEATLRKIDHLGSLEPSDEVNLDQIIDKVHPDIEFCRNTTLQRETFVSNLLSHLCLT